LEKNDEEEVSKSENGFDEFKKDNITD